MVYPDLWRCEETLLTSASPERSCKGKVKKSCFVANHIDWCIEHECIAYSEDGLEDQERCSHEDAEELGPCDIVRCGKCLESIVGTAADKRADYSMDEWQEEEFDDYLGGVMSKDSP